MSPVIARTVCGKVDFLAWGGRLTAQSPLGYGPAA